MYGITNNLDSSRSQSFTYDQLNRVQTAQTAASWGNSYVYDPWGNLLQKNVTKGTSETLNVAVNGSNQIVGYCYDAAGNLINAGGCGSTSYAYDAEGRMASAVGASYDYDGAGRRVKKSGGGNDLLYWYGQNAEAGGATQGFLLTWATGPRLRPLETRNLRRLRASEPRAEIPSAARDLLKLETPSGPVTCRTARKARISYYSLLLPKECARECPQLPTFSPRCAKSPPPSGWPMFAMPSVTWQCWPTRWQKPAKPSCR